MAGQKGSKRVCWASGVNLCQVRLFLSDDAPYLSASGNQDNLQAKSSFVSHSTSVPSDDSLPPGFEGPLQYQFRREIPLIKWQHPPKLSLKQEWLVVSGEESQEVALQTQRQLRVLEEIYPRLSCIPFNPSVSPELQSSLVNPMDDSQTPIIPIISIEDDEDLSEQHDAAVGTLPPNPIDHHLPPPPPPSPPNSIDHLLPPPPPLLPPTATAAEPDIMAAASAAFTAIMRSNEQGSLIDRDLLIKILSNPVMIEKLSENGASNPLIRPSPELQSSPVIPIVYPVKTSVQHSLPPVKDLSYYKSLIQKHGGDKQDGIFHDLGSKALETLIQGKGDGRGKPNKIPKPCVFFNSPKGCRNGSSCSYLHDSSVSMQILQQRGPKRVKLEREIAGRN